MKIHGALMAIVLSSRFYNLSLPAYVCWDETHFGKMAGLYINRTYFVDVHPPLGKMIIALAGLMTGYDGKFSFTSAGDEYNTENGQTNYYGMRALNAIMGSLVIPLIYGTVKTLTESTTGAFLTSCLLVFDCGFITLSQYILLDPILIFFMSATLFCTVKYSASNSTLGDNKSEILENDFFLRNISHPKTFSYSWWCYLFLSGVCLGCMLAVKWVGILTIIFVGCWTLQGLWNIWNASQDKAIKNIVKHFLARALCLVIVPVSIYTAVFVMHYQILDRNGRADGFHTSLFQSCLKGSSLYNTSMPLHVGFGSIVSLKHHRPSASGLLHSHQKNYPLEVLPVPHQQVSLYFHKDVHNFWQVTAPAVKENQNAPINKEVEFLQDGSIIRLRHVRTGHFLHSHPQPAPLSTEQQIVSAKNYSTPEEKLNELWKIQIVEKQGYDGQIQVMSTRFRLLHISTGCFLQSTSKILPDWAEGRYEVTCSHEHYSTAIWNVEQHSHRQLPDVSIPPCQMSFWERFLESHLGMTSFNSGMKDSKQDKMSRPWHWPLNYQGQVFTRMGEDDHRVYLLGNPLVFWVNFLVILMSSFIIVYSQIYIRQATKQSKDSHSITKEFILPQIRTSKSMFFLRSQHFLACKWFLFGWFVHYLPFFFISRALYFHHYYPAFIFSCCLSGCFLDLIFKSCSLHLKLLLRKKYFTFSRINRVILFIFFLCLLQSFYMFSPLCYGMTGPFSDEKDSVMYGLNFFNEWEI